LNRRAAAIAFLTLAVAAASCQAKLSSYHAEIQRPQLLAKVFKPSECRLGRTLNDPPGSTKSIPKVVENGCYSYSFQLVARLSASPRLPAYSAFRWFRPPPRAA